MFYLIVGIVKNIFISVHTRCYFGLIFSEWPHEKDWSKGYRPQLPGELFSPNYTWKQTTESITFYCIFSFGMGKVVIL